MLAGGPQRSALRGEHTFLPERRCGVLVYERAVTHDTVPERYARWQSHRNPFPFYLHLSLHLYIVCITGQYICFEYHQRLMGNSGRSVPAGSNF